MGSISFTQLLVPLREESRTERNTAYIVRRTWVQFYLFCFFFFFSHWARLFFFLLDYVTCRSVKLRLKKNLPEITLKLSDFGIMKNDRKNAILKNVKQWKTVCNFQQKLSMTIFFRDLRFEIFQLV